jgi:hypothetical protein
VCLGSACCCGQHVLGPARSCRTLDMARCARTARWHAQQQHYAARPSQQHAAHELPPRPDLLTKRSHSPSLASCTQRLDDARPPHSRAVSQRVDVRFNATAS